MKLTVSLPEEDVACLDEYAEEIGAKSRSAALHAAIAFLRAAKLEVSYAIAFGEWDQSEDSELWDSTVGDGVGSASR
ncbi:ribbon-helix-helix domain-containing protein [Nonomuraea sp. NPDC059194]|uniref:ribbon-helix-helix domain-containing protein n=1 Tax=Nonomuraea sp. NPDC059194 TaxID=3346764 RepID=UPI0036BBAE64